MGRVVFVERRNILVFWEINRGGDLRTKTHTRERKGSRETITLRWKDSHPPDLEPKEALNEAIQGEEKKANEDP